MVFRAFFNRIFLSGLLLGLLTPLAGRGQTPSPGKSVQGQVITMSGQPLAGVSVWEPGTTRSTSTNAEGMFLLQGLAEGTHSLLFDLPAHLRTEVVVSDTTRLPLRVKLHTTRPLGRARWY